MRAEELFAHAIAIEREAAARYAELGKRMQDLGDDDVAGLFEALAEEDLELEHELRERGARFTLPGVAHAEHAWLDCGVPQPGAHELVLRLLNRHAALRIARGAEQRALEFFEHALSAADDPATAHLAFLLAQDEREHLKRLESLLARTPEPLLDWSVLMA